jgi:isopenicillin N synthase-like dioxygenase
MSNAHPADYTTTVVRVRTGDHARVVTVAHYRTTNHKKVAHANRHGRAAIPYYISGATPGYTVEVTVTVTRGSRTGSCSTSFTPHS